MRIGVTGASGRMGQAVIRTIAELDPTLLAGALDRSGSDAIGRDAGALVGLESVGVYIEDDPQVFIPNCNVIVDFTRPEATLAYADIAAKNHVALVTGTTGFSPEQEAQLREYAKSTPILWARNMSIGVNLLQELVERTARTLAEEYDIEVVEMHHRHKVDAPSGTALALGEAAARGRGVHLPDVMDAARHGVTPPRKDGDIGFAVLRGGDVIGDHTVIFAGPGERIELTHKASDRSIFARGAVRAAQWLREREPGFYSMHDVMKVNH